MTDENNKRKDAPQKKQSDKDPKRLKAAWERLMQQQDAAFSARRVSKSADAISSVKIVKDDEKGEHVEIRTVAGQKISDSGEKKAEFQERAAETKMKNVSYSLDALIREVKEHGFADVADDLPPDVARALKAACERSGVSLSGDENRKKEAALQASFAAEAAEAEKINRQRNHKPPEPFTLDKELKRLLTMTNRIEINTRRSQTKIHLEKSRMIAEQRKRFDSEKNKLRRQFNEMQIDEYRQELFGPKGKAKIIEQKLQDGQPLTKAEQTLWNKKERYGIRENPEDEILTSEQKRARGQMSVRDYNKNITRLYNDALVRKKAIFTTKIKALETASEQILLNLAHGKKMDVNREVLEEYAVKLMPTRDQLTTKHLHKTCSQLQSRRTKLRTRVKEEREHRKSEIEKKLKEAMQKSGEKQRPSLQQGKRETRSPLTVELLQQLQKNKTR